MTHVVRILDTSALIGYMRQTNPHVAYQLAFCADRQLTMQISVLSAAEAYQVADPHETDLLDLMVRLPAIEMVECRVNDADVVGAIAKRVDRLSLAHSCLLVFAADVPLMTTDADTARLVLEDALVWQLRDN